MNENIAFFDTKPYDEKSFEQHNASVGFNITYFDAHLNKQTAQLCKGFDGVCVFVNDQIDAEVIQILLENNIRIIALRCAGYNNIDIKAASGKIKLVRVPAYSPYAVAEHTAALMLTLNRKTHQAYHRTRDGNFSINGLLGFDMHNRTAGVIGTGQIGRCLIAILKGFRMNVLAYDIAPDQAYADMAGISYVPIDELYSQSDIISLHCPLNQRTEHMIDRLSIEKMKPGVMLVNTSRGKLIDTKALIGGLKSGKIGYAALDVYEEEVDCFFEDKSLELMNDDILARLLTFPNVIITSHQGFFTEEALCNIAQTTLQNLSAFFQGEELKNEVCYVSPS